MTVRDAINSALDEEMARDERVFILGEEVRLERRSWTLLRPPGQACCLLAHLPLSNRPPSA
jgi:hypothetical protein